MANEKTLQTANSRLKLGGIGLAIEIKNNRLVLRGILPVKPNIDRYIPYEQKVYLGYPITAEAIKQAEKDALSIRASIIEKRFDWLDWSKELRAEAEKPVITVSTPIGWDGLRMTTLREEPKTLKASPHLHLNTYQ